VITEYNALAFPTLFIWKRNFGSLEKNFDFNQDEIFSRRTAGYTLLYPQK